MRIQCPFCKTEYGMDAMPSRVECACCGRKWTPAYGARRKNKFLKIFAIITMIFAALVFVFALLLPHTVKQRAIDSPLVINMDAVRPIVDAYGAQHFVVSGTIKNNTDQAYGIPDIIVKLMDDAGNVVAVQKFFAPAPVLDAFESVSFRHTLEYSGDGAKRVTAEFKQGSKTKEEAIKDD